MNKDYWIRLSTKEREMVRTALLMYITQNQMKKDIEEKWRKLYDYINY